MLRNLVFAVALVGCSAGSGPRDAGGGDASAPDALVMDGAATDAFAADAPATDAPTTDAPTTDAPATDAPASDAGVCNGCAAETMTWGTDGGRACTRDSSELASCRAYTHRRVAEGCSPPDLACTNEIAACDTAADAIVLRDVELALADPDVVAALAAAPVLYGTDPRAFDGSVFFVVVSGRRIEVGTCADATCAEIPPGVRALQALLGRLDAQEILRGECATVFPGG